MDFAAEHRVATTTEGHDARTKLAAEFRSQGGACLGLGSPLYAEVCEICAQDVEAGGIIGEILEPYARLRFGLAVPLRFLGALHRLALGGLAPELAEQYPSCGGTPDARLRSAVLRTASDRRAEILLGLEQPVQTNEVGRAAVQYEALGTVAADTGLALSLREIGCSGGLNLVMAWFRYVDGERVGGDPTSDLVITDRWRGPVRPALRPIECSDRAGCDPEPIDPTTPLGRLTLLGFLWPDQVERFHRIEHAIALAARHPARLDRANADRWLRAELADDARQRGVATVIFHSIVWQYIDKAERVRITELIESTGANATPDRPLAWVAFEPEKGAGRANTTLRLWDGTGRPGADGTPRVLAVHGFHGEWVELTGS